MADEKDKKKVVEKENRVIDGFKFGFGVFLAFLTGTVILGILTALIWWVLLLTR